MKPEDPIPIPKKPTKNNPTKNSLKNYAKYSSIAFEMIAVIMVGIFGGRFLDHLCGFHFPVFTLPLSLIFVGLAIYIAIKDFIHPK
jgi:F0F1-type ATP synthase assembly protein I